ncbi:hypothetical protein CGC56_08340 [Capnocytophaga canimorsus]|uniref:Uncharacterized protein n=1 Tax=Capnocytophaga canimorsus TaxID=28188 RepID=A0A250G4M5_9FLAO|nr:hypothetical protein [Capnocytophaga canimorsus]ATA92161.1 hypothetical protein CGC56_08340 [Capnocytophaga canimorsus]
MEQLQPNDSLKIIQEVINQRKQKYEQNGFFFIFWGILIVMAGILHFAMLKLNFHAEKSVLVWEILMPLGFIFTFVAKMRKGIKAEKQGKSIDWMDWIWLVAGIGAMVGGFTQSSKWIIVLIYLPFAMASLATALQLKNRLWIGTSLISFILVYSTLFINYGYYTILMTVVLAALLFLIPGIQLHSDYKKRNKNV